jgi:hypothetical protein
MKPVPPSRLKTKWLKMNIPEADEIIQRIKIFFQKAYPVEPEVPSSSRVPEKKSLTLSLLQEYGSSIGTEDDIDRYFDTSLVL